MIRTRGRKIIRDVLARKGRTALVSIAIFIGVTGTIALFSLSNILVRQLTEDLQEDRLAMLEMYVTPPTGVTFDNAAYVAGLEALPGVETVIGFTGHQSGTSLGRFKADPSDEGFEDAIINAYTQPLSDLPLEPMRIVDGEYPTAGANQIAVERRMADDFDIEAGQTLYFRVVGSEELEEWTVSGIVFHPYFDLPGDAMYVASIEEANHLGSVSGLGGFLARFVDFPTAEDNQDLFESYVANQTPYIPAGFTFVEDPENNQLIAGAQTIGNTMAFLALVALIVSGFLVINVISSIVIEQKRQIGVMKSMGASRFDTLVIYAGIAFAYGLIGVIPGVIVGIPAGNAASQALAPTLNTVLEGFQISPGAVILGIIVGLLVPVFASFLPVYLGTRVQILDAMTDLGIDANYGTGPIARFISILPIPMTVRQGFSNVSLKKSRLAFTVLTLAIAAGAFIGIYAVFNSLTTGINTYIDTFNVEIGLFPSEPRPSSTIVPLIEDNFSVEAGGVITGIEEGFNYLVEFEGYDPLIGAGGPPGIFAYGYDVTSDTPAFTFTVTEGQPLSAETAETGIIFSSLLAANMDKTVGDSVVLKVPGNQAELTIIGISDFPIDQVWIDWRTIARITGFVEGAAPPANQYFTTVTVDGYEGSMPDSQVMAIGVDEQAANFLPFAEGEFLTPGQPGVIVTQDFAETGGFELGDTITLNATTGDGTLDAPIVGIIQGSVPGQGEEIPSDLIGVYYQELAALEGRTGSGEPLPQGFFLVTNIDDPSVEDLDEVIEQIDEVMFSNGIQATGFNFVELVEQISQAFTTIQVVLQMVAGLIALVGALGLLTTLSMSVFERQKEIGVMRSIGASSGTVAIQFLTEGLVVGLISWLVGLPLAYLIEVGLLGVTGFDETFPATFPVDGAIIGLIGMLIIVTIASLWPSIAAARKTVSDILRYQ